MKYFNHAITTISLTSGARLVHVRVPNTSVSAASVWFRAGSRLDPVGKEGLAHFFEHLLMMKTKRFPDRVERLRFLESHGMYYNAFTTRELAHYFTIQLPEETKTALELLCDGLNDSNVTEEDIKRECDVINNEQLEHQNNPDQRIWHVADSAMWPGSLIGRELLGTDETIRTITKQDLELFAKKYYQAGNATFVVVSDDDPQDIANMINAMALPVGEKQNFQKEDFQKSPEPLTKELLDSDQAMVCLQFRTVSQTEDEYIVLDFISDYLANNWMSRLNQVLRVEKSLTYWTYGDSVEFSDTGYVRFTCSVKTKDIDQVIELASKEFVALGEDLLAAQNLKDHQAAFVSNFIRNHATAEQVMNWYGWASAIGQEPISLDEYIQKIQAITPEQIQKVAQEFLIKEKMSVVVMGV